MNLRNSPAFKYCSKRFCKADKEVCTQNFENAVEEAVINHEGDRGTLCVALDCTWQKLGHRSLNGVVTATAMAKLRLEGQFEEEESADNPAYASGHYQM
ncbi:hypothetical protein J6590_093267 [Homalodisca vitripennis]|nr:hypothetical protein J6590_093267 [Homalodisca vitripennis]